MIVTDAISDCAPAAAQQFERPSPIGLRIGQAMAMLGIGKTKLYQLIGSGELETIRAGPRRAAGQYRCVCRAPPPRTKVKRAIRSRCSAVDCVTTRLRQPTQRQGYSFESVERCACAPTASFRAYSKAGRTSTSGPRLTVESDYGFPADFGRAGQRGCAVV